MRTRLAPLRLSSLAGAALVVLLLGCGGQSPPSPRLDAAPPPSEAIPADAVEDAVEAGTDSSASDHEPDAGADAARDTRPDAGIPADRCFAGATCSGGGACLRPCFGERVNRCFCSGGRLFCTGCMSADAGADTDARDFPNCEGNASVQGGGCRRRGDVCDFPREAMQRLCVCADVGSDLVWICQ
jgi:hypothetical protein